MATASSSRTATKAPKPEEIPVEGPEMELYQACSNPEAARPLWFQEHLKELDCMANKSLMELLSCVQHLVNNCLFRAMDRSGLPCWKIVPLDLASKIRKMGEHERMVYWEIEASGGEGIWIRSIKARVNIQIHEANAAVKKLEIKGLVKQFQTAKSGTKKFYILSSLQPSEDATGGIFFDSGHVDANLIRILMQMAEVFIHRQAWESPKDEEVKRENGKRKRSVVHVDEDILSGKRRWQGVKPMPAGYTGYATVSEIARFVNSTGVLSNGKILENEIERILNLLCYDGRVEQLSYGGYRTILRPISHPYENEPQEPPITGLSEAPCGGCPAFNLCDESGPVNARTCTYFQDWLMPQG